MPRNASPELEIQVAHTAALDASTLGAARALLDQAFAPEMTEQDWEHGLGGMHALAWEGEQLVGHGAVVLRRLLHDGRALRTGYIECVAVRADRRRRGYGAAIMNELERIVRGAYELGALGASEMGAALYVARGWKRWQGQTWTLSPAGRVRTAHEDGSIYVLEVASVLDPAGDLTCDWRDGQVW
ncbi:MAG: GNAT family N-acetyltransferase [Myxococcales bacterium]|nr:GNAT family N-acetyltransferase [Myxococcales bacterium]